MNRDQDIIQIRKYLNGELNARAMHELERRALDDPFLADALEGFEQTKTDQQDNLKELTTRLQQRTDKKVKRFIPWAPLSVAASILMILGGGIWFFSNRAQNNPEKIIVQNVEHEKKPALVSQSPVATIDTLKPKQDIAIARVPTPKHHAAKAYANNKKEPEATESPIQSPSADKEVVAAAPVATTNAGYDETLYKPKKDSVAANEMIVKDMSQKKRSNVSAVPNNSKFSQSTQTLLKSRADSVTVTPGDGMTVTGTVMDNGGIPITGATVRVAGRNFGAVTDANGKFMLSSVGKNQTLTVNYIGYASKKVKADKDSLNISLEPTNNSLAEVVVTRTALKKPEEAHPVGGWDVLNDYLKNNAQSPDGKTGRVKLTFIVAADGSLSQFNVTKSLSDIADKKATELITNGPKWAGGTDGKPKEVKVTVVFK